MRTGDLRAYLRGYVRIRITGAAPERFVNLAWSRGHLLWNTRRGPRSIEANIAVDSFKRLRPIARRTRVRVRIVSRHGLPFLFRRATRRPLFLVGLAVSICLLYTLTSMVWLVRVVGAEALDPGLLREVAAGVGLRPGVFKASVELRHVERSMLLAVHGLSWVAVEMHGVVAVIRIVERKPLERPEVALPPVDVVAAKDGVITSMVVIAGEPVVREGDTVKAGDMLILGRQSGSAPSAGAPGQASPPVPGEVAPSEVPVVAKGIVKARVWYQAYAEARLHTLTHVPTGKTWRQVYAVVAGRRIPLWGWWKPPSGVYERSETRWDGSRLESIGLPVEIVSVISTEVRDVRKDLSPEEAELEAREAAAASLYRQLPEDSQPGPCRFEVTRKSDILIGVLASLETVEDIAQPRERR